MKIWEMLKTRCIKGTMAMPIPHTPVAELEGLGQELQAKIKQTFGRSLHIRQVDTGSCGACLSEIIACNNPIYDLGRFGVNFVASPRHADLRLVTGPVSKNMVIALKKTYAAMAEPKYVMTVGDCALDGGEFRNSYYTMSGVGQIIPVIINIPGCPPSPLEIIRGILKIIS